MVRACSRERDTPAPPLESIPTASSGNPVQSNGLAPPQLLLPLTDQSDVDIAPRDLKPKLESFRYLHIPKTGTSFIIVLRNYLDSCPVKHFSCPSVQGGGGDFLVSQGRKKRRTFAFNATEAEMARSVDCGGSLIACGVPKKRHSHVPWGWKGQREQNVVTMLRDPLVRLVSQFAWERSKLDTLDERIADFNAMMLGCLDLGDEKARLRDPKCIQYATRGGYGDAAIKLLSGHFYEVRRMPMTDEHIQLARRRLFNETVFYGLTDMWKESVCTFHCELGGQAMESEYLNTRSNGNMSRDKLGGIHPRVMKFLDGLLEQEKLLYEDARRRFLERAGKCGCLHTDES